MNQFTLLIVIEYGIFFCSKTRTPSAPSCGRSVPETKKITNSIKPSVNKEKLLLSKKSDNNQGVINDRNLGIDSRNNIDDLTTEKRVRIREHLFAQLDILKRSKRILTQGVSHGIDKELYCAHEKLLTKLNSRKTFPRSVAYSALKLEKMKSNSHKSDPVPLTPREKFLAGREYFLDEEKKSENSIEILMTALIEDKEYYDRILKGKLNRIPLSKIGKEDLKDIFQTWYKTQKNLEFYESFQDEKSLKENNYADTVTGIGTGADTDTDILKRIKLHSKKEKMNSTEIIEMNKLRELKLQTIDLLSCNSDMISSTSTTCDETVISREWLINTLQENENYHNEIDLRIRYLVEVSIGRNELKAAIKLLKECCEMEKEGKDKKYHHRQDVDLDMNQRKWIFALKYYKAVYTCLAVAAQNATSCMFISNNNMQ